MPKLKVSATIDPDRLAQARDLAGRDRTVSDVLDLALGAFVERELEARWLAAHPADRLTDFRDVDLPGDIPVDLSDLAWDDGNDES